MGKIRHGFVSKKQKNKRLRIIEGRKKRWRDKNEGNATVSDDHSYCLTTQTGEMDLSAVADEIVVSSGVNEWRIGRRVVELSVLADGLSACKRCGVPPYLMHATGIITYGLSTIIKAPCSNTQCGFIHNVPTGKRHNRIWDANTKLATAMLHAGLGAEQVNKVLFTLNIPTVSNSLISSLTFDRQ